MRLHFNREFTVLADSIEKSIAEKQDIAGDVFELLSETAATLFQTEEAVRDMWCAVENFDEAVFRADQDKSLHYKLRWHKVRSMFTKTLPRAGSASSLHSAESNRKQRLPTLPKLELVKFDGNIKSWLLFWGQFKKVHEDADIDPCDKFMYLLQSMTPNSSARHLIESYPPCAENYAKAVEALKARFARNDVLIETYVRGLLQLMQRKEETQNLPVLYDNLQSHLQALDTLGVTKDKYASMLFPMIESTLPEDVLRAWHRSQPETRDLSKLMQFMRQEVESEERIRLARSELDANTLAEPKPPTACFMTESKRDKDGSKRQSGALCVWCDKESHSAVECYKAAKMTLEDRVAHIKSKKACSICLKSNHVAKKCKSFPKCLFCKKRHFTIMCAEMAGNSINSKQHPATEPSNSLSCQQKPTTTLLQTLIVKVIHGKKEVSVRALIDSGAQRSYIKKDLAQKLGLKPTTKEVMNLCLFGGFETKKQECQIFDISVKNPQNDFCINLSVVEQSKICNNLPKLDSVKVLRQLQQCGVKFNDTTDSPHEVSLLIGADFSGLIMTGDFMQLGDNLTAVRTKLGWTVQGSITGIYNPVANMTTTLHCLTKVDLTDLWSLEALGITDPAVQATKSARDLDILKTFEENIKINNEGRYEVCLPWRDVPRPQSNFDLAKKRVESTSHRLEKLGKINDYDSPIRNRLTTDNTVRAECSRTIHTDIDVDKIYNVVRADYTTDARPVRSY